MELPQSKVSITLVMTVVLSMLFTFGCINPFAPRLDFKPSVQVGSDLTVLENVFRTFSNTYAFRDTTLYSSIISKDFVFTYRDYDQGIDVSWGRTEEMRTTYLLFQSVQSLSLLWNNELSNSGNDTLRTIVRGFSLTVTFNPSDIFRIDGYATLTLARRSEKNSWQIVHWRDESNF